MTSFTASRSPFFNHEASRDFLRDQSVDGRAAPDKLDDEEAKKQDGDTRVLPAGKFAFAQAMRSPPPPPTRAHTLLLQHDHFDYPHPLRVHHRAPLPVVMSRLARSSRSRRFRMLVPRLVDVELAAAGQRHFGEHAPALILHRSAGDPA